MKKCLLFASIFLLSLAVLGCQTTTTGVPRVEDERNLSIQDYTVANLATTDALGRPLYTGDVKNDKTVGLFYHVWHGYHTTGIYNITQLLEFDAESLWDIDGNATSPLEAFHYWGEPLYGYYCSDDPWVITRHVELLTMAGIDYLVYDLTNSVIYIDAINALFEVLDKYQKQGFDVPKVAFYTNSGSQSTINRCYDLWYKDGKYSNLWFSFDEKPLIIGVSSELTDAERELYFNFFDFRESQWPYGYDEDLENGFPWMEWGYPQKNYRGTVSVSLAQHPGARMSEGNRSNNGRGFDYSIFSNVTANKRSGSNYQGQWETVFKDTSVVDNVFITGFNEWIAIKYSDGQDVFFVDTFNEEYSRDIEMCKNGYGDNYVLQTMANIRRFTYTDAKNYITPEKTIDITDLTGAGWADVPSQYADFAGDALERNFRNAATTKIYTDNSNRNDIIRTAMTHDKNNLYLLVETLDPITEYNGTDVNWMNVLLDTSADENSFAGYEYFINRHPGNGTTSIERVSATGTYETVGEAQYTISGNLMQISIPWASIGLSSDNFALNFKVADHISKPLDIMDYYVSGDSAPIGRLGYRYGN